LQSLLLFQRTHLAATFHAAGLCNDVKRSTRAATRVNMCLTDLAYYQFKQTLA
jgi:hypothetical protein